MKIIQLTKEKINYVLIDRKCLFCNKPIEFDTLFDKSNLLIVFIVQCLKCGCLKIFKRVKSLEELEYYYNEIQKTTLLANQRKRGSV